GRWGGVSGTWVTYAWPRPVCGPPGEDDFAGAVSTMPGVIGYYSSTRLADITDGATNTMLFGERAHGMIADAQRDNFHFWFSGGNTPQTPMSTTHPLKPPPRGQKLPRPAARSRRGPWHSPAPPPPRCGAIHRSPAAGA